MRIRNAILWAAGPLAFATGISGQERERQPPMSERAAAAALLDNRLTPERDRALRLAAELGPRATPDLRAAVIEAAWAELRGETNRPEGSEAIFDYLWAVNRLRDPRAIPFMIEALGTGPRNANALADLGPVAFPAVLAAVEDPEGYARPVSGGLMALRFMVEDGSLNVGQLEQVREVARDRLSRTQDSMVARDAVRLAVVLGDPELRRIVETLATDRTAAEAFVSPYMSSGKLASRDHRDWSVRSVQDEARKSLTGVDFPPIRRPVGPGNGS